MKEFKGTPKTWKLRNERLEKVQYVNGGVNHCIYKVDIQADITNRHIVEIRGASQFQNELQANATLISAAPDLLEACIRMVYDVPIGSENYDAYTLAQAAISKAISLNN